MALAVGSTLVWSASAQASDPFIAEITIFAGNFAPRNWAFCDGQLLPIAQNTALFSLIGTTYGGDGRTTTALPNLQGRFAMHEGNGPGLTPRILGERGGSERISLTVNNLPIHSHSSTAVTVKARSGLGNTDNPAGNVWSRKPRTRSYSAAAPNAAMNSAAVTIGSTGGSQAINDNLPPYLVVNHIIALVGIFPSR
jgi:microcystin-dependent protein